MSAQVTITQLPTAGTITGTEAVPIVQNGVTVQTTASALAGSPIQTQTFITLNQEPTLANSRYLGATNGLTLTASSPQGPVNVTTTGALLSVVNSGTGLQAKTSSTAVTGRTITAGTSGVTVSNGDGISGNPTVSLDAPLVALATSGILAPTYGGTGVTSVTGTNKAVLSTAPVFDTIVDFQPQTAPAYSQGRVWYDSTEKSLAYYNDATNNAVHIGQETIVKVVNNTGTTIPFGACVYVTSTATGYSYPGVALAKADVLGTAAVIGITNTAIAAGAIGYVVAAGMITNINTASFNNGDVLYLSPYSAGSLMNIVPPTGYAVQVGVCAYGHASLGSIYTKQTTPLAISALTLVGAVGVANGGTGFTTTATAPTIASASTIAPTKYISLVSGTTTINTITAPSALSGSGGQITLIPTGLWSTSISGNIALATTAVVNKALIMTYNSGTALWYPSY